MIMRWQFYACAFEGPGVLIFTRGCSTGDENLQPEQLAKIEFNVTLPQVEGATANGAADR
jgi:hypothetical protein